MAVPVALKLLGIPDAIRAGHPHPAALAAAVSRRSCSRSPASTDTGRAARSPQWRWVTWGSAIAGGIWIVGSLLLSWYVANFGNYNATYGSLGAVIGFMVWMWLSTIVVLIGGEINAEMEHQTAKDTTEGGRKPMGARGARWPTRSARRAPEP